MTSASQVLTEARKYLGIRVGSSGHHNIVDTYNAHKPLALGYKVRYTDNWCDAFVSFVMIKLSATALTDTECGVERHTKLFAKLGIWIEDGTITPKPGDIIVYNWDDTSQPNDGFADHIGFVESVSGRTITTIEGNKGIPGTVARRQISVGNGVIRGYARPRYAGSSASATITTTPAAKPTGKGGTYTFAATTNVRAAASTSAAVVAQYKAGQTVSYSSTVQAEGYTWMVYTGASGKTRYVAQTNGTTVSKPAASSIGGRVAQSGTWRARATVNVRAAASTSAEVVAQYKAGQTVKYDSYIDAEGIRWCSYIGGSGKRRYVARRNLKTGYLYADAY